jgi:glycosyltransferase involved in cell wall biosynthesis
MLPSLDRLRETGVMIVIEQCIAPRAQFVAAMERMRHSLQERGLAIDMTDLENEIAVAQLFSAVEQAEWSFADRIYCPSKFVASALQEVGVVAAKTRLLPYGVSIDMEAINRTQSTHKPRVTFCGRFSWRKGALEFGALASALKADAQFEVLGQVGLPSDVIKAIAPDVQLRGHLNRADYRRTLAGSDLMVLPSYSEGSATVVYEAMAMGVPCVVSAEAGSVITHRQDGLIVSAGDLEGLIAAVASLLEDSVLRREIGQQAALTAQSYTRESYGARVVDAIHNDLVEFRSS